RDPERPPPLLPPFPTRRSSDLASRSVLRSGRPVALTPKEFDLLVALLRRGGAVASRMELLTEVWGYSAAVLSRTVDTHVAELRRSEEHTSELQSLRHLVCRLLL